MAALEKQVGGNHYKKYVIEPVELFAAVKWDYFQSAIARYVLRHGDKNKEEDLQKAIHVAHLSHELDNVYAATDTTRRFVAWFCKANQLEPRMCRLLHGINEGCWNDVCFSVKELIKEYQSKEEEK